MSGGIDKLTDKAVRGFAARRKQGVEPRTKLADGGGLYLFVTPAGAPVWRIKYRHGGKERTYSAGAYPEVTLEAARAAREWVRARLAEGNDPVQARRVERSANVASGAATFGRATELWLERKRREWSAVHYLKSSQALERDVLPTLGKLPTESITTGMIARVVEAINKRGATQTAPKVLYCVRQIFAFANAKGFVSMAQNPAVDAAAALERATEHRSHAAYLTFAELGTVLRSAEAAGISRQVHMAHRLIAFTASRISNAVEAHWKEFDLEGETPTWTIPRAQMKVSKRRAHDHRVVLGPVIAHELRRWHAATGGEGYLFVSPHGKQPHITKEAVEKAYRVTLALSGKHSVHGWRASFSTLARDAGYERDVVELTLDHVHDNQTARAYDRGERWAERCKLMAWWNAELNTAQYGEVEGVRDISRRAAGR